MDDNFTEVVESVETPEVADPESVSEEVEEAAETPVKTESDARFADMRRQLAAANKRVSELESASKRTSEALGLFFDGKDDNEKVAQAIAYHEQRPVEDVRKEQNALNEANAVRLENDSLRQEVGLLRAREMMAQDLKTIQAIDPEVKSLDDLGDTYINLIAKGVSATDAYYAAKARETAEKITPPKTAGKVNSGNVEKDFYTKEEVEAHKSDKGWISKNFEKIQASMSKW